MTDFTPAEMVETTGFSLDTLRYYEKEGLLGPIDRTAGGRRRYRQSDVDWLDLVRCLRDTGMPIADLKEYSRLATDASTLRERLALLEAHEVQVQAAAARLKVQQEQLSEKIDWYRLQLR